MVSAKQSDSNKLIKATAEQLQGKMEMPEWAKYVKTGSGKERQPDDAQWWFVRSASVLRKIYLNGPVGVQRLRSVYGNLKNRGHKPSKFRRGSGKILRVILQDLEKTGYVVQSKTNKKGRIVTSEGQKFLDNVAKSIK
tara:strand:+ start:260 stop:673 length:414 start_codon:yes stop_codon:yes gene_type:complete